jgi:hypothetical protein
MTNEYKIAILLPTRGRTEALDRSLLGLLEKATDLSSIQVLLGLDNDDKVGIAHFQDELQSKLVEEIVCVMCGLFPFHPKECRKCNKLLCKHC